MILGASPAVQAAPSAYCAQLAQQLTAFDNAGHAGANAQDIDRHERAIEKQLAALDRASANARRLGCDRSRFFLFQRGRPAACDRLEQQRRSMRHNLDALEGQLDRLMQRPARNDAQKQRIVEALARSGCGGEAGLQNDRHDQDARAPDYFRTPPPDAGTGEQISRGSFTGRRLLGGVPSYRTLCVRTCDGFYFPVSFSTLPRRFEHDASQCQSMCPTAPVELFVHENPGGGVEQMQALDGRPYSEMPYAWRFRKEYVEGCSCNRVTLSLEDAAAQRKNGRKANRADKDTAGAAR